jgi:hypothetical protein
MPVFYFAVNTQKQQGYAPVLTYLSGEWMLMNCSVNTPDNATLFRKVYGQDKYAVHVDNKKVKMPAKNVFNITNLSSSDRATYTCEVCSVVVKKTILSFRKGKFLILPAHFLQFYVAVLSTVDCSGWGGGRNAIQREIEQLLMFIYTSVM